MEKIIPTEVGATNITIIITRMPHNSISWRDPHNFYARKCPKIDIVEIYNQKLPKGIKQITKIR